MEAETMQEEHLREENLQLLIEIAQLCNRRDRTRVENILLLGNTGAGKSSLVNTIIGALAGRYIPKAATGAGLTQSKTLTLQRYESCGITEEDIENSLRRDIVKNILPKLPTLLDVAGRKNVDENKQEAVEEILELLIGGFIPPGTSIEELEAKQEKYYVGGLRDVYKTSKTEWKVTKVVFVQSCREGVPERLIKCLGRVLGKADCKSGQLKYTADVFVVLTKYDLVTDQKELGENPDSETGSMSIEKFKQFENEIAVLFNIKGAQENNMIHWVSYTDGRSINNPYIDHIALKFIKLMMTPRNQPGESTLVPFTALNEIKLTAKKWWKKASASYVLLAIFFIFLSYVMVTLLFAKPN